MIIDLVIIMLLHLNGDLFVHLTVLLMRMKQNQKIEDISLLLHKQTVLRIIHMFLQRLNGLNGHVKLIL